MPRKPTPREVDQAVAASEQVVRVKRLLPGKADLESRFGDRQYDPAAPHLGGLERGRGKRWTYHFPKPQDPEKSKRVAAEVFDMTEPWRKAEIERSGNQNAAVPTVGISTAGGRRKVPELIAERVERRDRARSFGFSRRYSEAPYWRRRG